MNIGQVIKNLRQQKGYKQNEFAKICNLTQAYLSQIESNNKEPNISTLKTIASNLDIPLPILFFLSIEVTDVQPKKQQAYELLAPSLKSLLNGFFSSNEEN